MNARDFCYWLQGFFEMKAAGLPPNVAEDISHHQAVTIRNHLALVFKHELDPAIDGGDPKKKDEIGTIHGPQPGTWPPVGPTIRC